MTNLVTDVAETAATHPDRMAVAFRGRELTYGTIWRRTGRLARALADAGLEPGDRVGVALPNRPEFVTAYYGILRAGGVVVPMNPQYKAREIAHVLADSRASVVMGSDPVPFVREVRADTAVERVLGGGGEAEGATPFEEFLADDTLNVVDRAADDVAVQPYTSGTTGTPKGVLLTHRNLAWTTRASAELLEDGIRSDDRLLGVLPLFHIYGMTVVMNAGLFNGAVYYPMPVWDAREAVALIEAEDLTVFYGVPAMFNDIVNLSDAAEFDLSSLRFVNSGGSSVSVEVIDRFEALYDVELYEGYGLTETSPVTHANRSGARRKGSIGRPIPGVEARIVDEEFEERPPVEKGPVDEGSVGLDDVVGELVVAGPNVMKGYHGRPAATEAAFTEADGRVWLHTGDLGYRDEDGFFYVVDRDKHLIVTGGYNVYPREVEELLFEHEYVADAAVVGVPDERRGETVKAFIVPASAANGPADGDEPDGVLTPDTTPEEIKQYCLDNLAEYKHPREVEFVEELPRTATGKVRKFELRERDPEVKARKG